MVVLEPTEKVSRLYHGLFEGVVFGGVEVVTIPDALLVLILCEDGIGTAGQQHHADQKGNDA